ncbi:DUF5367 domain-containing protein [Elizabethkingia anophelis]|uniref:DUF5367 domain-containing protein n=1 Tax=Elizabethkingia TaxID=308865 RepID=UPI001A1EA164|nr:MULTISPECIES: DUF5367 domain-containing protein [Elizabethkingia]MCT3669336.1 DUF5367 domain-containing protein [Elizabethkingia anophelis]MCT3688889.1 DUF5367 domain-containing protein [Elizabethkingia anophelis]MCT3705735.1 DUF5367 domain-containing protein [Elizabethkingia anophelis]MCT3712753.1 DUF5367 domain-containing protein [Elizabethkingia anophelis]MCT3716171.1 DUF5367 domain-containing protein [Elizabethkingia anophelis]
MTTQQRSSFISVLGIGFLIWLLATIAFRVAGQYFFITDSAVVLSILYIVVVPVLGLVTVFTCRKFRLTGLENVAAGVLLVLPGMLIDTFVIQFFGSIFPNMPESNASTFGSWLMWAYTIVLITSVIIGLGQTTNSTR